ncbi:hypothetical protein GOODEAATRI_005334 [Goodea atripinnis]|uniref:Uncharacterized protein n=1 Tax=Goodea atripinnis TaxID=208336 RepID=A0ABV0PBJ4_9TELE
MTRVPMFVLNSDCHGIESQPIEPFWTPLPHSFHTISCLITVEKNKGCKNLKVIYYRYAWVAIVKNCLAFGAYRCLRGPILECARALTHFICHREYTTHAGHDTNS